MLWRTNNVEKAQAGVLISEKSGSSMFFVFCKKIWHTSCHILSHWGIKATMSVINKIQRKSLLNW